MSMISEILTTDRACWLCGSQMHRGVFHSNTIPVLSDVCECGARAIADNATMRAHSRLPARWRTQVHGRDCC